MHAQGFLRTPSSFSISVKLESQVPAEPRREIVRLHVVGSLAGIEAITHSLHRKHFAEVNEWSKPQPTGNPGEYISVLFRNVLLE